MSNCTESVSIIHVTNLGSTALFYFFCYCSIFLILPVPSMRFCDTWLISTPWTQILLMTVPSRVLYYTEMLGYVDISASSFSWSSPLDFAKQVLTWRGCFLPGWCLLLLFLVWWVFTPEARVCVLVFWQLGLRHAPPLSLTQCRGKNWRCIEVRTS